MEFANSAIDLLWSIDQWQPLRSDRWRAQLRRVRKKKEPPRTTVRAMPLAAPPSPSAPRRFTIDIFQHSDGAKFGRPSPLPPWLVAFVWSGNWRDGRRPAHRWIRSRSLHGNRARDRHRAQSARATACISARSRVLSQDPLALGRCFARLADRTWR